MFRIWVAHLQELEGLYILAIQVSSSGSRSPLHSDPPPAVDLHIYTPTVMSSTKFQAILDASLDNYAKLTGIVLSKHPSTDKLQNCQSPEDIVQVLLERETTFNDHRDKYRKLIDCLRPVVQIIHGFSDVIGKAAGLVSSRHRISQIIYLSLPFRCHSNRQKRYSSRSMFSSPYVSHFSILHPVPALMGYLSILGGSWRQRKL